jgi:hypothetical protein
MDRLAVSEKTTTRANMPTIQPKRQNGTPAMLASQAA